MELTPMKQQGKQRELEEQVNFELAPVNGPKVTQPIVGLEIKKKLKTLQNQYYDKK